VAIPADGAAREKERRRSSFSHADDEVERIAALGVSFYEEVHVSAPVPDARALEAAAALKAAILAREDAASAGQEVLKPLLDPDNLQRILRARKFNAEDSLELAVQILEWRLKERPDLMRASDELEKECCTGKARLGTEFDRHGRPILILDSSAENTSDPKKQVRHVLYQMERVIRRMEASPNRDVEKQCVFVHLNDFSIWNCPSMSNSKQTVAILSKFFCERMGHGIAFQPPAYFSIFLKMIKPFVDPVTYGKVVIIKGDYSPGSANDEKMQLLIGPDWKRKCGVDQPRQGKKSSPGYNHKTYWPALLAEEQEFFDAHQPAADKEDGESKEN
jgi:hypothetical protein